MGTISPQQIICDIKQHQIINIRVPFLNNTYNVTDSLNIINWQIQSTRKKIGEFACQLASGIFRGRTYNAWFTASIPISVGPWKLSGLPGLILEAYDNTNSVRFEFVNFIKIDLISNLDRETKDDIRISKFEWKRMTNAFYEDPQNFINQVTQNSSFNLKITSLKGFNTKNSNKINNPIELSDN